MQSVAAINRWLSKSYPSMGAMQLQNQDSMQTSSFSFCFEVKQALSVKALVTVSALPRESLGFEMQMSNINYWIRC